MKGKLGRRLAWGTGVALCLLALVSLFTFRHRLIDRWWLSMAMAGPEMTRLRAIDNLSRKSSNRILTALYTIANDPESSPAIREAAAKAMQRVAHRIASSVPPPVGFWTAFQEARMRQPDT